MQEQFQDSGVRIKQFSTLDGMLWISGKKQSRKRFLEPQWRKNQVEESL